MRLFLMGARGTGKSTLLREALMPHRDKLSGFMVQRLHEGGIQIGFRALSINGQFPPLEAEYEDSMEDVFILRGQKDVSVLERVIAQAETDSLLRGSKLIVLDEIGGFELTSELFMNTLMRILTNGLACIGVLKSRESLEHTLGKLQIEGRYLELRAALETAIKINGEILDFDADSGAAKRVRAFVRECMEDHS